MKKNETDHSEVICILHAEAEKIEANALPLMLEGKIHQAHVEFEIAKSLRISANFLDGVSAT